MDIKLIQKIKAIITDALKNVATKDDLKSLEENIDKKLKVLREEVKEDIGEAFADVFQAADKHKAEKKVVEALEERVGEIEKTLQIH